MPFLLRTSTNKRRWDWNSSDLTWLPRDDLPGAPFGDLAPSVDSKLSMWLVEDGRENVNRIVAALAAGRMGLDKFDYLLVEEEALLDLGLVIEPQEEECLDSEASSRWHCNVLRFTASRLTNLVRLIYSSGRKERLIKPEVREIVLAGIDAGQIDRSRVHRRLLDELTANRAP